MGHAERGSLGYVCVLYSLRFARLQRQSENLGIEKQRSLSDECYLLRHHPAEGETQNVHFGWVPAINARLPWRLTPLLFGLQATGPSLPTSGRSAVADHQAPWASQSSA